MTTEQKERLVQAAFEIAKSTEQRDNPISTAIERSHVVKWVKQGGQTVLDNYHDYGLQSMEKYEDMVSSNVRLGAENQRLRKVLESIIHDKDVITANDMIAVAEEALRQDVPKP